MSPIATGPTAPRVRLAVVVSHPTQYYSPWFTWLAANTAVELRVFYLWDFGVKARHDRQFGATFTWDRDLLAGHEHEFVPNRAANPGTHSFKGLDNPKLGARLRAWRPDAVLLFGYNFRTHLRLILRRPAPLIFRGDSHLIDRPPPRGWKSWLLKRIFARFAAITYVGQANRDYFLAHGVPPEKLFFSPHCVDASHFTATEATRAEAAALREQLGLAGRRIVLFAGKFLPAKQPLELLAAFQALAPAGAALVFVGGGEEQAALAAAAASRPDVAVRILPFANQTEMPARYLLADIFALPSRGLYETWGLAINEAMHLGIPCLVSDRVGCQRDLVTDGVTGWVFRAEDPNQLREKLAQALAADLAAFKPRVAERISHYDFAAASRGLTAALENLRT
jgi:glycosyltransferase involved in cell wall biosynthesis